jgi:hypothetical protein
VREYGQSPIHYDVSAFEGNSELTATLPNGITPIPGTKFQGVS